jgi:hypothetical protein
LYSARDESIDVLRKQQSSDRIVKRAKACEARR